MGTALCEADSVSRGQSVRGYACTQRQVKYACIMIGKQHTPTYILDDYLPPGLLCLGSGRRNDHQVKVGCVVIDSD